MRSLAQLILMNARAEGKVALAFTLYVTINEDLAAGTDFEVSYIGGLEAGLRNPTLRNLAAVANGLKVRV